MSSRDGFTLLELLAGIAVGSLLLVFVFQLLTYLTAARSHLKNRGLDHHRRQVLWTILNRDLTSLPVGKRELQGTKNKLSFITVVPESDRHLQLQTKVQYTVEPASKGQKLYRRWKWVDLHDDYQAKELLARGKEIYFHYSAKPAKWVSSIAELKRSPRSVRLQIDEQELLVDCLHNQSDSGVIAAPARYSHNFISPGGRRITLNG